MPGPLTFRRLATWVGGLLALWVSVEAEAHVPAAVELSVKVRPEAVTLNLRVRDDVFRAWFGVEAPVGEEPPTGPLGDLERAVGEEVGGWARVAIDRIPVKGVVEGIQRTTWSDHGLTFTYAVLAVAYGTKGPPREVAIAWTHFEEAAGVHVGELETEVEGFGETSYFVLKPREPELVWHRPHAKVVREVPVPRLSAGRREVVVSLPALVLALLVVVGGLLSLRVRGLRRPVVGLVLAVAAVGLGAARVLPVSLPLPGSTGPERPGSEEAKALFESLLRNVYRAFDHDREDAIYDTLAHSVSGALLDRVYEEVFASLVMKEQGGAVSKVEKVDVLDAELLPAEAPSDPSFRVRALWRVHGKVGHWGHTHQRVNEHRAVYTVAPEGDRWKIAGVEVLSQTRVDTDGR